MSSLFIWAILCLCSLFLVAYSASKLVYWSVHLASVLRVSQFVIAVVVVGFGTSSPELSVSAMAALAEKESIALGNAFGSNIINIAIGIGLSAVCLPLVFNPVQSRSGIWLILLANSLVIIMLWNAWLSRFEGLVLLVAGLLYMGVTIWHSRMRERNFIVAAMPKSACLNDQSSPMLWRIVLGVVCWLLVLLVSSHLMIDASVRLARLFGLSELVIGLTLVAVGTSLPEIASCVAAAVKRQGELVLGNIVGSCIFNLLFVVGIIGILSPHITDPNLLMRDIPWMIGMTLIFSCMCLLQKKSARIGRLAGVCLLSIWCVYLLSLGGVFGELPTAFNFLSYGE